MAARTHFSRGDFRQLVPVVETNERKRVEIKFAAVNYFVPLLQNVSGLEDVLSIM